MTKAAIYGAPKVGGDALSYCGKCKMELAHVIISMLDTHPAKVICKTCNSQHKYRGAPAAAGPGRRSRTAAPPKVSIRAVDLWQKKTEDAANRAVLSYSPKESFTQGSLLQHAQFGLGYVETVVSPKKIVVLFRDGEKILIHGI